MLQVLSRIMPLAQIQSKVLVPQLLVLSDQGKLVSVIKVL